MKYVYKPRSEWHKRFDMTENKVYEGDWNGLMVYSSDGVYIELINDLGYTNGIIKININFVRYKVGSEDVLESVWIEEISPSREEIRIIPLKTKFPNINSKTNQQ